MVLEKWDTLIEERTCLVLSFSFDTFVNSSLDSRGPLAFIGFANAFFFCWGVLNLIGSVYATYFNWKQIMWIDETKINRFTRRYLLLLFLVNNWFLDSSFNLAIFVFYVQSFESLLRIDRILRNRRYLQISQCMIICLWVQTMKSRRSRSTKSNRYFSTHSWLNFHSKHPFTSCWETWRESNFIFVVCFTAPIIVFRAEFPIISFGRNRGNEIKTVRCFSMPG